MESAFLSAVQDRPPVSETSLMIKDVYEILVGKPHPRLTELKRQRAKAMFEYELEQARAKARARREEKARRDA